MRPLDDQHPFGVHPQWLKEDKDAGFTDTAKYYVNTDPILAGKASSVGLGVALARPDKRVVVLSDLADDPLPSGEPVTWTPLEALSEVAPNCGIASAEQQGRAAIVKVGCNRAEAAAGRKLQLFEAGDESGEPLGEEPLNAVADVREDSVEIWAGTQGPNPASLKSLPASEFEMLKGG